MSDEGFGFLRSFLFNKVLLFINFILLFNMSDVDKVYILVIFFCDLFIERKIVNKVDYGIIYY